MAFLLMTKINITPVLVLNVSFEPINITSLKRAVRMILNGKATLEETDGQYLTIIRQINGIGSHSIHRMYGAQNNSSERSDRGCSCPTRIPSSPGVTAHA